ncbi:MULTISPECIES: hypothetical protein [Helcococcus]|uniref:Uncharacterized protein n=1 Tax=Helcococcus bovis TaxID=3153252 RepID=A0ABW9F7M3_9FIRM
MKNIIKKFFVVLFSTLFIFNSIMITKVDASEIKDIPDLFTYYDI